MRFAFSPSARSFRLANHRPRRFIFPYPVTLTMLVLTAALLLATIDGPNNTRPPRPTLLSNRTLPRAQTRDPSPSENDLNGDGKLDLAVANLNSNSVSVLLNTTVPGATTQNFAAKQDFATGAGPVSVTTMISMGMASLIWLVANFNSNNVSVLLNTSVPRRPHVSFADKQDVATGDGPIYVTMSDLNGDGKLDLAVVNLLLNSVSVLPNTTAAGGATPDLPRNRSSPLEAKAPYPFRSGT